MLRLSTPAVPMLRDDNITIREVRRHAIVELDAPAAFFERFAGLDTRKRSVHHSPALHTVIMGLLMQTVENRNLLAAGNGQQSMQVCDGVRLLETVADHTVELAILVQKVVVRINQNDRGAVVGHLDFGGDMDSSRSGEIQKQSSGKLE